MTLTQARARCPKLIARAQDPECENTAREVLLEIADSFSPRVEEPLLGEESFGGIIYLDIDGLDRHYRPETGQTRNAPECPESTAEYRLGLELMQRLDDAGLPAKVGIASSKLAARVAASLSRTAPPPSDEPGVEINQKKARQLIAPKIVDAGCEADFLAPLPMHRLTPHTETATTLERWGIESVGDFAKLPKAQVRSRLGEIGHRLHLVARGIDPRPLIARAPTHSLREGMSLEWPVANLEPFLFVARGALERLCHRLERRGLGCKRLEMSLQLEPEGFHERSIELPSPTREAKTLLTLVRLDLEANTPNAPILRFQFTAQPDTPRLAQMSLFGPAALSPDRLATTIARLFALLGPQRVGSPRPAAGHLPERFSLVEYTPPPPPKVRKRFEPGRGLLAVRVLRPPVELEVVTDEPLCIDPVEPTVEPTTSVASSSIARPPSRKQGASPGIHREGKAAEEVAEPPNSSGYSKQDPRATRPLRPIHEDFAKDAFARESDSGVRRETQDHDRDDSPKFSEEVEGLERQTGLFRPSPRSSYRPVHISSEQARKDASIEAAAKAAKSERTIAAPSPASASRSRKVRSDRKVVMHQTTPSRRKPEQRTLRIQGKVRIASGPWELEEKWWQENRTERDYWDVELSDGALYRIFRNRQDGRWFADGIYD